MILKSLELKALGLLAALVALLAIPTTYSIVLEKKPNAPVEAVVTQATIIKNPDALRKIASVSKSIAKTNEEQKQANNPFASVMSYQCREDHELVVSSETLRFKGFSDDCMNEQWTDISIVNSANGYTAEVIFHKNGYTTDYIDLKEGSNQLLLKATALDGSQIERKINILKRSIASTPDSN